MVLRPTFALEEAVEQGEGIGVLADAQGRTLPGLVRLDVDLPLPSVPVFLAFHKDLRQVPRVRLVVGALEAALRHALR
ncbi:hypothetical protein ACN28E_52005 [Archangium lansingense]|uniref:hypothetical protein n=1 Tax=Archangium lansingense TaxID=2995310 RepID=UPI003B7ACCD6